MAADLSIDSYVRGPPPQQVSIRNVYYEAVVAVHRPATEESWLGYFLNPGRSDSFKRMLGEIGQAGNPEGMEVILAGMTTEQAGEAPINAEIGRRREELIAALTGIGVPKGSIRELYSRKASLADITYNMKTGTLTQRQIPTNGLPDPYEVPVVEEPVPEEAHDPSDVQPEPDESFVDPRETGRFGR